MCGGEDAGGGGDFGGAPSPNSTATGFEPGGTGGISVGSSFGGFEGGATDAATGDAPAGGSPGGIAGLTKSQAISDKIGKFVSKYALNAVLPGLGTGVGWIVDKARAAGKLPGNSDDIDAGPQTSEAWDDPYLMNYMAQMTGQPYQQSANNVLSSMYGMIPPYGGPGQVAQPNLATASAPQYVYPTFAPLAYLRPQAGTNQQSSGSRPILGTQNALIRNKFA